ncbi:hypothetical protein ACJX0J_018000, partial [Zea mays]
QKDDNVLFVSQQVHSCVTGAILKFTMTHVSKQFIGMYIHIDTTYRITTIHMYLFGMDSIHFLDMDAQNEYTRKPIMFVNIIYSLSNGKLVKCYDITPTY